MKRRGRRPLRKNAKSRKSRRRPLRKGVSARGARLMARREINRMVETQDADNRTSDVLIGALGSTSWNLGLQCFCVTPNTGGNQGIVIGQGVGEGARKGNRIRTSRASIRFTVVPEPYHATNNPTPRPQIVKYMVLTAKRGVPFNNLTDVISFSVDCFDTGSGTTGANGSIYDLLEPLNTEKYTVLKSGSMKLFWSRYDGTGNASQNGGMGANNEFKAYAMKKLNLTKYCPKVIHWVDNANQNPTSKAVWIIFYSVPADGSIPLTGTNPVRLKLLQEFKFKDL